MSKFVCQNCTDNKTCPRRESIVPKVTTLKLSKREEDLGETRPHDITITNEVGLYSPNGTSGDSCRTIQEIDWDGDKYLRLGYYIYNPEKKKWRWGQNTPIIDQKELFNLIERAKKIGIIK